MKLGIAKIWLYGRLQGQFRLRILLLQNSEYIESTISPNFPGMPISEVIPQFIQQSETTGRIQTIRRSEPGLEKAGKTSSSQVFDRQSG